MKFFKSTFIIIAYAVYVPLVAQNNDPLAKFSYLLDANQGIFIAMNKNNSIDLIEAMTSTNRNDSVDIIQGDFKGNTFKTKNYLFDNGIIFNNKKDSIDSYDNWNFFFEGEKFTFVSPAFEFKIFNKKGKHRGDYIKYVGSRKKDAVCDIAIHNYTVKIDFNGAVKDQSTLEILSYLGLITKLDKVREARTEDKDSTPWYAIGFAAGSNWRNR